ncbi:MAG: hypothetical protein ACYDGM_14370 [Vulcanimicrobiaceae bacterium]
MSNVHLQLDAPSGPGYGQVWRIPNGASVIILGNCISNGNTVWTADLETGKRHDPVFTSLLPSDTVLTFPEIATKCRGWAHDGNSDAAWWLGHYYEYGGDDGFGDGKKALAYYVAACRRNPAHGRDTWWRPYCDREWMFSMSSADRTKENIALAKCVIARFPEFREPIVTYERPDLDWRDAIAIAEEP